MTLQNTGGNGRSLLVLMFYITFLENQTISEESDLPNFNLFIESGPTK